MPYRRLGKRVCVLLLRRIGDNVYRDTDPFVLPRFSVTSDWDLELFSKLVGGEWVG